MVKLHEFQVEKSPSNQTHCEYCQKLIEKDTMRLVIIESGFQFPHKSYACAICGTDRLNREIIYLAEKKKILNK